jgi:hypothetical protein
VPVTLTLIVFVVAPVFHLILPEQPVAAVMIVADSPLHKHIDCVCCFVFHLIFRALLWLIDCLCWC